MNNLSDSEIIKALECCSSTDSYCSACPYCGEPRTCVVKKSKDALDLINRQQAEIERLLQRKYQSSDWSHGEHPFVVEENDILNVLEETG